MSRISRVVVLMTVVVLGVPATAAALDVGDAAPELTVGEWVRGESVLLSQAKGKSVVIVEFWATWCPPCRESAPHLSALQAKHKARGLVVVGLTKEAAGEVKEWLTDHPEIKMDYHVGVDKQGLTDKVYMKGVDGIPHAFIVDKAGVVCWKGHPLDGMDRVLEQVLAGTFDLKKAKEKTQLRKALFSAAQRGAMDDALKSCEQLIAVDSADPEAYGLKVRILEAMEQPDKAFAAKKAMADAFQGSAEVLSALAMRTVQQTAATPPDVELALQAAGQAVKVSRRKDVTSLAALGQVYGRLGLWDTSIALLAEALKIADGEEKEPVGEMLKRARGMKALSEKHATVPSTAPTP